MMTFKQHIAYEQEQLKQQEPLWIRPTLQSFITIMRALNDEIINEQDEVTRNMLHARRDRIIQCIIDLNLSALFDNKPSNLKLRELVRMFREL